MATLALFVALGGGAYASLLGKNSVKSRHIAPNAVKAQEIARGAVGESELRNGVVTAGKLAPGVAVEGPRGPEGARGPEGEPGSSVFDASIPSGKTIAGQWLLNKFGIPVDQFVRESISFLLPAPEPIADARFGAAAFAGSISDAEEDPECDGAAAAPTAPPGKLCFYVNAVNVGVAANSLAAFTGIIDGGSGFLARSGGFVRATSSGAANGQIDVRGAWAYTAP
jgi:hypothetical protein